MQTSLDLLGVIGTIKAILPQAPARAVFCRVGRLGFKRFVGRSWKRVDEQSNGDVATLLFRDYKSERMFCPVHRRWEHFRQDRGPFSFVCQFNAKFAGVPVHYVLPSLPCLRYHDRDKVRLMKRLHELDSEGIGNDVMLYVVTCDFTTCECTLTITHVDYDHFVKGDHTLYEFPQTYSHVFRYKFGQGLLPEGAAGQGHNPYPRPETPQVPAVVGKYLEAAELTMAKFFVGREITVNRRYYRGEKLLAALSHCPYEANMHHVLAADGGGAKNGSTLPAATSTTLGVNTTVSKVFPSCARPLTTGRRRSTISSACTTGASATST